MNKVLSFSLSILLVLLGYASISYLKKQSRVEIQDEDDSYFIGKRFPANSKIEHATFGITHAKKLPKNFVSPKNDYTVTEQPLDTFENAGQIGEAPGVMINPAASSKTKTTTKSRRRDNSVPQEIQNFVKSQDAPKSSSTASNITSMVIPFARPQTTAPATPTIPVSETYSGSGSSSSGAAPIVLRLRGKVIPLQNVITKLDESWFSRSVNAYAAPVCSSPKIGVYRTEDLLKLGASPLQELQLTVGADFSFPTLDPSIDTSKPQNYSLQVSGCDVYYSRILTDFIEDQNINLVSTFISFSQVSPVNIGPMDVNSSDFKALVKELEKSSASLNTYEDIFAQLNSSGLAPAFNNAFNGSSPDSLKSALPMVHSIIVPNSFDEEVSQVMSVAATHWSVDYTVATEWFIDGVSAGFGNSFSWAPDANSSPSVVIKAFVGKKKDLLDQVDTTSPYHQFTFTRPVVNTISPIPPALALISTVDLVSSTPHLNLELDTGAELPNGTYNNCRTFTSLAITETATSPAAGDFNIICSSETTQSLTYSLNVANRADGAKNLYLWAKDDLGSISSTPTILHIYLDQTAPIINFSTLSSLYGGGRSIALNWETTDHTVDDTQKFELEFFDGTLWTAMPDVALINGPLTGQMFTTNFTFPDADLTSAKFRITATDLLGHTSSTESSIFNIQRAILTSSPTSYNFGDIEAQGISPATTITYRNISAWTSGVCSAPALSGDTSQFTILSQNCSTVSLAANGTCTVSVRANPQLRQAYTADVTLLCGNSTISTSVMVTGGNNPPVLSATSGQTTNEDVAINFGVSTATDLDGDAITYEVVAGPSHGTLLNCFGGTSDVSCSYTPDLNYNGADSFSYRAYDGTNYSSTQTVALTITPVNDAPTLGATQSVAAFEETSITFNLNGGADIENDTLSYIVVSSTSSGSLTCVGGISRSCTYVPGTDFVGDDTFVYKTNDGLLDSTTATVTISVSNVNDAPVAAADFPLAVTEDVAKSFTLAAGTDVDLPAQTLTYTLMTAPAHGVLSGCIEAAPSTDRTCVYTPDADYNGLDSFTYKVCDSGICSSSNTNVSITVSPANDAPVMIANQTFSVNDTQDIAFDLFGATDIDVPADTLSYKLTAAVTQGTLTGCIDESGWTTGLSCSFRPPANFNGAITLSYKAYDGNLESATSSSFTFNVSDKTPSPVPSLSLFSPAITNVATAAVTVASCTDTTALFVSINSSDPDGTDAGWVPCATSNGYLTTALSGFNGIQKVYVWSKDQYDNVSTSSFVEVVYDSIAPTLAFLSSHNVKGNIAATIGFKVTELHGTNTEPYYFRYHDGSSWTDWTLAGVTAALNNQVFTTTINTPNADNILLQVEVKTKDIVGNEGIASAQFRTDLGIPYMDMLSINSGSLNAANNNVSIAIQAHDDGSKVQYFCLKYNDNSSPADNDPCWRDVSAPSPGIPGALAIDFNSYFFQIGFTKATYQVYAWVKDEADQISVNSGIIGIDKYDIFYDPGTPPRINGMQVTNTDAPSDPVTAGDMNAPSGSPIYIKWDAHDTEGFATNPISIEYTLNDVDFFPMPSGADLQNGINGSCTIDARFTGCTVLNSPSTGYFKIRIIAQDEADSTVYLNSAPLNDSKLRIIAGNTESGLGGSAISALFYNHGSSKNVSSVMKNVLAVSEDGKFFYIDPVRGLLWVDPATGVLKNFIPITGASTGDGGLAKDATLWSAQGIALDAYNHLLIWDWGSIRRVNLTTMIITTIIGGGAQSDPVATINANQMALAGMDRMWGTFTPLPNGDILFNSPANSLTQRRYRAADQKIVTMQLQGQGYEGYGSADWAGAMPTDMAVSYNTTTSEITHILKGFYKGFVGDAFNMYAIIDANSGSEGVPYQGNGPHNSGLSHGTMTTGLDGKMYYVDRFRTVLRRYDPVANSAPVILGTGGGASVPCLDGTLATSCTIDMDAYFVSKAGRVYFIDNGLIRTIDDSGNILTLFGQFPSYGNGEIATTARFGNIVDFKLGKHSAANDKVIVMDGFSSEFREFTINSTIDKVSDAPFSWHGPYRFETDPATGDIMGSYGGNLRRYDRVLQTWNYIVGGGGHAYYDPSSVGKTGAEIANISGYDTYTAGFSKNKIYHYKYHWIGYDTGCVMSAYDASNSYTREHFMGNGSCAGVQTVGAPLAGQNFGATNMTDIIDPNDGLEKVFFMELGGSRIFTVRPTTGELDVFADMGKGTYSFAHKTDGTGLNFFYCNGGKLWKYNYTLNQNDVLSWPSTTLYCKDTRTIIYNPERNSIIFSFTQNSLNGIGEYKLD